jgi:16S rRNA (guanine527-N7)-methyltransferase
MSAAPRPPPVSGPDDFAARFGVSRETIEKLSAYEALLKQWQPTINLVAPSTLSDVWDRHFADSAQVLALAPSEAKSWLDLGSGAGFPGLVLAILLAGRGSAKMTLIEIDQRKAAFLREVARKTGAPVDILCERIEKVPTHDSVVSRETAGWDVITARALAPLPRLLELAAPYFSEDTVGLFLKGREAQAEVDNALKEWEFAVALHPSQTDDEGRVVAVSALTAKTEDHSQ